MEVGEQKPVIDSMGRKRGLKQWVICPACEEGRWVRIDGLRLSCFTGMCLKCHNKYTSQTREKHGRWKGGVGKWGPYPMIRLPIDSPFYPMARKNSGCVYVHRLIMAQHLNRCLESWEVVHHINGDKSDNKIGNLQLTTPFEHSPNTILITTINRLKKENRKLKEIIKSILTSKKGTP